MDTIVALSTPWGRSAIGVLRLSGPSSRMIAERVCPNGPTWTPRRASVRTVLHHSGSTIDDVLALWMPGPNSYTGEDVVELSGHGNPVLLSAVLDALVAAGARPARPGEFTRRAFENGKTNLLHAEALNALISARTFAGTQDARAGMRGSMDEQVTALREQLLDLAAELEARLDHPDDDLSRESDVEVCDKLLLIHRTSQETAQTWSSSKVRQQGARVALIGPVNAGKSSLFNHLVGSQRALVSDRPGTTRDVVERGVLIGGMDITFMDTAGEGGTDDALEQAGVALGQSLSSEADLRLVVLPLHLPVAESAQALLSRGEHVVVGTFADQPVHSAGPQVQLRVNNMTGEGVEALCGRIREMVGLERSRDQEVVVLSQRQHDLYRAVGEHCEAAATALTGALGPAVAASEIVYAIERLGELVGIDAREAVLDRLFSRFCIGK
jgi:tRNA modification GTPase